MSRRFLPIVTLSLWTAGTLLLAGVARSEVKLTSATVRNLKNKVELQPKGERWRGASVGNMLQPLDALRTAAQSWAELRFNDRSLARVGERAQFQFLPDTRTFNLRNGTVLLLIPPKQGRTRVETPNAVAGIRGSALFVRYNPETETTIVGALTNSQIEVGQNKEGSPPVVLKAGQMAVLVQDKIFQIYQFDLKTFYETSEMVRDLDLQKQSPTSSDEAIAAVQAETSEALNSQPSATTAAVVNPPWVTMTPAPTATNLVDANTPVQTGIDRSLKEGIFPLTTPPEMAAGKGRTYTPDTVPPSVPPSTPAVTGPVVNNPDTPTSGGGLGRQGGPDQPVNNRPQTPSNPVPTPTPQPINNRPSSPSSPNLQPPSAPAQSPPAVVTPPPVQTPAPVVSTPPVQTPAPAVTPPVTPPPNQVQPVVTNPTPVVTPPPAVVQPPTPVTPPVVAAPTPPAQSPPVVVTPPIQSPVYNRPTTPVVPAVPAVPPTPVTPVTPAIPAQPPVVSAPAPTPVVTPVVQPTPQPVTVAPAPVTTPPVTPTVTPSTTVSPLLNNQATVTTPPPASAPTPTPVQSTTQTTTPTTGTTP